MALWGLWGAAHAKDERKRVSSRVAALAAKGGGEGRGSTEGGLVAVFFAVHAYGTVPYPPSFVWGTTTASVERLMLLYILLARTRLM